jgi:23S rRNA (guanosine2251-2'-O)-methyltransferase
MRWLQESGVWLIGSAGEAEEELYDVDLSGALAIVMGSEGRGMRRLTRENCDRVIKIPMLGSVESLNISVATGVICYEILRQRKTTTK